MIKLARSAILSLVTSAAVLIMSPMMVSQAQATGTNAWGPWVPWDQSSDQEIFTQQNVAIQNSSILRPGDIIFQQSLSSQAKALEEGTGSRWTHVGVLMVENNKWYVVEARRGVEVTPLSRFISRGRNHHFVVKRLRQNVHRLSTTDIANLRSELYRVGDRPYDIYFEWDDRKIYCSELVWKIYQRAIGLQIGQVQRFRDMNLNAPAVKKLIRDRLTRTGREVNLNEPIITPISVMNSQLLETVTYR